MAVPRPTPKTNEVEDRLKQRRQDALPVAPPAQHVAVPDDVDAAHGRPQRADGAPRRRRGPRVGRACAARRVIAALAQARRELAHQRRRSLALLARGWRGPVSFRNTSSRVGRWMPIDLTRRLIAAHQRRHELVAARRPRAAAAARRGTAAPGPSARASSAVASSLSSVRSGDHVAADRRLQRSGVSSATIWPWSMIAMRSQYSASSM